MTRLIQYRGEIVGVAGGSAFFPAPRIAALPTGAPLKNFVVFMWAYHEEVRRGRAPGPYTDERAELFARCALIDEEEFVMAASTAVNDRELADRFAVPVEQIPAKRQDLARRVRAREGSGG